MKKTLEQWKKEIDEGIARGKADVETGRVYKLDENFIRNMENRLLNRVKNKKDIDFNNKIFVNKNIEEWILV